MKKYFAIILASAITGGAFLTQAPAQAWGGVFAANHPRRAEVIGRDNFQRGQLRADRGMLGGHYNQLRREDNSIQRQERRDARINGGFITRGQQAHLNREENRVQRQIYRDYR